jgi:hypothetical protein
MATSSATRTVLCSWQYDHGGANAHILGARGDLAAIREEAGEQAVPRKTVLAWPDFIESNPVAQLNLFERIMQHLFWRHTFGPGGNGKQTEFHAVSLE